MSINKIEKLKRKLEEESRELKEKLKEIEAMYNFEVRKNLNHAKFIIAGELLKYPEKEKIIKQIIEGKEFSAKDAECLKILLDRYKITNINVKQRQNDLDNKLIKA